MCEPGVTFRNAAYTNHKDDHFWVVVYGPHDDGIFVANFTATENLPDPDCVFDHRDHPEITKECALNDHRSRVVDTSVFEKLISEGDVYTLEPMGEDLLDDIRYFIKRSDNLSKEANKYLRNHII